MKKLLSLLAMVMMAVGANAQAVIAEVDWTQESAYYSDVWYSRETATVSVTSEGLVIESTPPEGAEFWTAIVPMIAHVNDIKAGDRYQVKFTVNSSVAGEARVELTDFSCFSDEQIVNIKEGINEITVDLQGITDDCSNAMVMYECGHLPGTHVITKVKVFDLDANPVDDLAYVFSEASKTAEVKKLSKNHHAYINIPETVIHNGEEYTINKIGDNAFSGSSDLISVNIPNTVTSIGHDAFLNCRNLISVNIPNSVTSIGYNAFSYCSSLLSVNIPSSLTRISQYAFSSCSSLSTLSIPSSVNCIDSHAFAGCTSLASVDFLSSETRISDFVFYGCSRLSEMNIRITDNASFCNNGIVSQLRKEEFGRSITLLDTDGNEIKEFNIPSRVTSIGDGAFYHCSGLTSVVIPNSVTSIGEGAFEGCNELTSLTLPEDMSIIQRKTLYGCSKLKQIIIPASVEYIYQEAFARCENLIQVDALPENPPFMFENAFSNYGIILRVPENSKDEYMSTEPWSKFSTIMSLTEEPQGIYKCANPTISYSYGILTFDCETKGAVCQSTITDTDIASYSSNEVQLGITYQISVYATKPGYEDSDMVTATLCWIEEDDEATEIVENTTYVPAHAVLIQSNGGTLTISGTYAGMAINVYDTAGSLVGSAKASSDTTTVNTSLQSGEIAIVKIGEKAVKVLIR